MSKMMMALGDYRFSVETAAYERIQRTNTYRWSALERHGRAPAHQFLGPGEESVTFEGTIYPHFKGGLQQIEAMRQEADKGEALLLIDSSGIAWGRYCIRRIAETRSQIFGTGHPRKKTFQLELVAYGEDSE